MRSSHLRSFNARAPIYRRLAFGLSLRFFENRAGTWNINLSPHFGCGREASGGKRCRDLVAGAHRPQRALLQEVTTPCCFPLLRTEHKSKVTAEKQTARRFSLSTDFNYIDLAVTNLNKRVWAAELSELTGCIRSRQESVEPA
jgi:hypothetical protein